MGVTTNKTIILKSLQEGRNKSLSGGILKIDLLRQTATLSLPLLNISQDENAYLIIAGEDKRPTHFKLLNHKRQEIALSNEFLIKESLSALIAICENESVTPLLLGSESETPINPKELIEYAKSIENKNKTSPAQKSATADELKKEEILQCLTNYDDEAIADVNYYEYNQEGEIQRATIREQDACSFNANFKSNAQEENECYSSGYETSPCNAEQQKEPEYYRSIKEKLTPLFNKYPSIDALTAIIPHSRWIKIPFDNHKHYAVGTIKENGEMKYLVYGVPGFYSSKPKGFESNSYFIPLSVFNLLGEGYWCVFQEAESGKQIQRTTV